MSLETLGTKYVGMFASILVLTVVISSAPTVFAESKFDDMCKMMYERYKELGEQKFREKYKNKSFLNECMKMYKNPNWYFVGKGKIDKNYEKIDMLMHDAKEKKIDVKILSSVSLGKEKFLVKFRACMENSAILQPSFLIKSPIEQYVVLSSKTLQTGKCNDYHVQIKAKQTSSIQIEYVSDLSKYPNIKSKMI
ncbi:hypothetical protein [Candidatus Nitrosotenuis sp. DW1]|uniref:hypothetical protein n=1 Tax=Candidatus Nitrosotenuis sp. DW1 TaxID=2259672 RepID=UPI0015CEA69D|nr:hypothetical protein [Candidatus Nitrosotenuis sp. DW1]QLH09265.1 hypothetical protein DSQ19_07095 [Candidatus Nitrosotenuis sp. DW1]